MYDIIELNEKLVAELRDIARKLSIANPESLKKQELIYKILDQQAVNPQLIAKVRPEKPAKVQAPAVVVVEEVVPPIEIVPLTNSEAPVVASSREK